MSGLTRNRGVCRKKELDRDDIPSYVSEGSAGNAKRPSRRPKNLENET